MITLSQLLRATGLCVALAACALSLALQPLRAQQRPDTTAVVRDTTGPRPERKPPLSPRRAFLYSLLLPGYSQSILGRGKTGTLIVGFEAAALIMIRESAANVRDARRFLADSVPVSFVDADGTPRVRYEPTRFSSALLRTREEQLEDWIAVVIANHLFSAADAYVAALLWDLPAEVGLRASPRAAGFALRLFW